MSALVELRARVLLEEARVMGIDIADLVAVAQPAAAPTLAEVIESIERTFSSATSRTYRPYWRLATEVHGDRPIASLSVEHLQEIVDRSALRAQERRVGSNGRASRETTVAALRALFQRAAAAGLVTTNHAAMLTKPRRPRSRRRALDDSELHDLIAAVVSTSRDPDLDLLLVRFHLESGARRQGALALRLADLDPGRSTVWLHEKGDADREQPVAPSLLDQLTKLSQRRRGNDPGDPVFRTPTGSAMSARRYDTIFSNARQALSWSARTPVSAHVLRHTAVTAIGRIAGYPVAQAFAGHAAPSVTGRYLHATIGEVAAAVATMTGEAHPLAPGHDPAARCDRQRSRHPTR